MDERHHRAGSAIYGRGKERLSEILNAGRDLLAEGGYAGFSMRKLAARIGVKLGAIQHYFPTLNDLLSAVWEHITASYYENTKRIIEQKIREAPNTSPEEKFLAVIEYLIDDIKDPKTNGLFFELWSQAQRSDFVADLLARVYSTNMKQIKGLLKEVNPRLSPKQRTLRAALISTQIEGLMVLLAAPIRSRINLGGLEAEARKQILKLATAPAD